MTSWLIPWALLKIHSLHSGKLITNLCFHKNFQSSQEFKVLQPQILHHYCKASALPQSPTRLQNGEWRGGRWGWSRNGREESDWASHWWGSGSACTALCVNFTSPKSTTLITRLQVQLTDTVKQMKLAYTQSEVVHWYSKRQKDNVPCITCNESTLFFRNKRLRVWNRKTTYRYCSDR